ncbi:hypothetical protein BGZ82_002673 [Podila clonocystis]|nr:hypothetical protein BGZ82_002673 [Podila clonocystis]
MPMTSQHIYGFESATPETVTPRDTNVGANLRARALDVKTTSDYDTLLKHLPGHVELTYYDKKPPLCEVLLKHITRFRVFKAENKPCYISEAPSNELFVISNRLRVFDSIARYIHVDKMLRRSWLCMRLEWLSCRIVGVDRLTDEEQAMVDRVMDPGYSNDLAAEEVVAVEKFERCRAQQHGVYDVPSLTKLKRLDLGYENRYPWTHKRSGEVYEVEGVQYLKYTMPPTFDTLELSLASGLDGLAALKELEMIRFKCINHRIGRTEVDWMAKSWPKLNLIYGLDNERLYDIEPSQERAALKEYFQQLRPDKQIK